MKKRTLTAEQQAEKVTKNIYIQGNHTAGYLVTPSLRHYARSRTFKRLCDAKLYAYGLAEKDSAGVWRCINGF